MLLCPIPTGLTGGGGRALSRPRTPQRLGWKAGTVSLPVPGCSSCSCAVGTRFFFSKTEACSLPAPLEMEVNSTNNPSAQRPGACGAALPLAASPSGLEGLPGLPSAPPDPAPRGLPFPSQERTESPSSSEPWRPGPRPGPSRKHSVPGRSLTPVRVFFLNLTELSRTQGALGSRLVPG